MANNGSQEIPGTLRVMVKVWGGFSALVCAGFGVFVMVTIHAACLATGALMIATGLLVLILEAPVLCFKIEAVTKISKWIDDHLRFWLKAFVYLCLSIPPLVLCTELSTFIGSGAVLVTAVLYAVMAIGKKGQGPAKSEEDDVEMNESLVDNKGEPKALGSPT